MLSIELKYARYKIGRSMYSQAKYASKLTDGFACWWYNNGEFQVFLPVQTQTYLPRPVGGNLLRHKYVHILTLAFTSVEIQTDFSISAWRQKEIKISSIFTVRNKQLTANDIVTHLL